jgi:Arm DNA-binding domain
VRFENSVWNLTYGVTCRSYFLDTHTLRHPAQRRSSDAELPRSGRIVGCSALLGITVTLWYFTSAAVEKRGVGTLTDPAVTGLMLRVRKTSTRGIVREFRFRYKFNRRTGVIALGNFPGVSLADARARAQRLRGLLRDGIDPRSAMNRPRPRTAIEVPAAGNSHNLGPAPQIVRRLTPLAYPAKRRI